jgi:hypothetical protein
MQTLRRIRKSRTVLIRTLVGLLAAAGHAAALGAQAPDPAATKPAEPPPGALQRTYLNKGIIQLPIQIDERARTQVKEIQLFVKTKADASWQKYARATWGQNVFTFNAPHDGEFWFAMLTVDHQGRTTPPDINKEGPGLIVIVDRQAPQVELSNLGSTPDGELIQCEALDDYIDPQKTRVHYQTGDKVFRPLEPQAGKTNVFCIPAQAAFTGMLRMSAVDLAGNVSTREVHLDQVPSAGAAPAAVAAPTPSVGVPLEPRPLPFVVGEPKLSPPPAALPLTLVPEKPVTATERQVNKIAVPAAAPVPVAVAVSEGPVIPQEATPLPGLPAERPDLRPAQQPRETVSQQRQLVNNPHVFLEYAIEQAGASGVGKVEVWLTRDQGQTWQRHCEDADKKSPAEIDLPGEGLFGIALAISNGRGFGAAAPVSGEAPPWCIEVDTTRPTVEITSVRAVPDAPGSLQISWRAGDKNIAADGVELYYAVTRQGPWRPIAKGLRNDGLYRWTPPADAGSHAYLRLCARDQAGNTGLSETTQPTQLDDQSRPRAQILGASTGVPTRAVTLPQ